jgi:hypothetical protein
MRRTIERVLSIGGGIYIIYINVCVCVCVCTTSGWR